MNSGVLILAVLHTQRGSAVEGSSGGARSQQTLDMNTRGALVAQQRSSRSQHSNRSRRLERADPGSGGR